MSAGRTLVIVLVAVSAIGLGNAAAIGQGTPCLAVQDSVAVFRSQVSRYLQGMGDSAGAATYDLPWAEPSEVQLVRDPATCAALVAAFNTASGGAGTAEAETAAYVFALGDRGYAYFRPGEATRFHRTMYLFTAQFEYVATFEL